MNDEQRSLYDWYGDKPDHQLDDPAEYHPFNQTEDALSADVVDDDAPMPLEMSADDRTSVEIPEAEIEAAAPVQHDAHADHDAIPTAPTWMERVLDFFGVRPDPARRLYALTHAITIAPESMVNYVLRGELYLERRQYELAADDFEKALTLAEDELTTGDGRSLGVVAQGVQDRALVGYETALRYMQERVTISTL